MTIKWQKQPDYEEKARNRFLSKIAHCPTTGCWLWLGTMLSRGYGVFKWRAQPHLAHRISLRFAGREIKPSLTVDHLCRTKSCVNPDHLEVVSVRENLLRAPNSPSTKNLQKSHCKNGHPLFGENLLVVPRPSGRTERWCKTCTAATSRAYRQRRPSRLSSPPT